MTMTKLGNKIMRRVYYAFFLRLVTHPVSVHSLIIATSLLALSQAVSIPSIWHNLMSIKVGEVMSYLLGAFVNTQFAVQILSSVFIAALISLLVSLFRSRRFVLVESEAEWV